MAKAKPVGGGGGGYKKPQKPKMSNADKVADAIYGSIYNTTEVVGKPIGWAVDKAHPYKLVKGIESGIRRITDSKGPPAGSFMSTKPAPKKATAAAAAYAAKKKAELAAPKKASGPTKSPMATADRARAVAAAKKKAVAKKTGTPRPKKR